MSTRLAYFLGFIVICLLLLTSIYLQLFKGIMPCPLCTLQRLCFGLLGIVFLVGMLLHANRISRFCIHSFVTVISILGVFLAGRQIWLQHFSTVDASECGVSLQYMMQALPLNEVMKKIFQGSAECATRGWEFLYFNMAEWALIWFIFFLFLGLFLFLKRLKQASR
jgi:protein dithiol:quinone oxidoreductase